MAAQARSRDLSSGPHTMIPSYHSLLPSPSWQSLCWLAGFVDTLSAPTKAQGLAEGIRHLLGKQLDT